MKIMTAKIFKSKDVIISEPPATKYKVSNIYIDPETGKVIVVYDNTPV